MVSYAEQWHILSMEKTELWILDEYHEYLREWNARYLVNLLAVPVKPSAELSHALPATIGYTPSGKRSERECQSQSRLIALPNELLENIIQYLDFRSCFVLSLVSRRLWNFGWHYTELKFMDLLGPWAGTRLICLDNRYTTELPVGFVTSREKKGLEEDWEEVEERQLQYERLAARCLAFGGTPLPEREYTPRQVSLLHVAYREFRTNDCWEDKGPEFQPHYHSVLCDLLSLLQLRYLKDRARSDDNDHHSSSSDEESPVAANQLPEPYASQARQFADYSVERYYPVSELWILRNLTANEFVNGKNLHAAFHTSGKLYGRDIGYPGFGEAVMCRSRWSPDKIRGVWAGHRFEICTEKRHKMHSNGSWKDVTSEITLELSDYLDLLILSPEEQQWNERQQGANEGQQANEEQQDHD